MMEGTMQISKKKLSNKDITVSTDWLLGLDIKEDRYYSISDVSSFCYDVKPYVLRYWETQFSNFSPTRRNSRRYYVKKDIILVRNIYNLVQLQRYTVEGAKGYLANENKRLSERSEKIHPVKNSIINALEQIDKALTLDC
jgi:DNA-binding transcriptional MerR regulator